MAYVFISYTHRDRAFVDRLCADLNAHGVEVWIDRQQLLPGTDWADEIRKVIEQAAAILVVVSSHTATSSQGTFPRQILSGLSRTPNRRVNQAIIPLLIDDGGRPPLQWLNLQFQDFRGNYDDALKRLLSALPSILRRADPVPEVTEKAKGYFFLSYAEEDTDFVLNMRQFLTDRGYGYFDYQESEREYYGTQFYLELERQIAQAAAVFCVMSPDWKLSQWTPKEYLFALETAIPTFLLRARDPGPTLLVAGVPYIDFVKDPPQGFDKLDRELRRKKLI